MGGGREGHVPTIFSRINVITCPNLSRIGLKRLDVSIKV